MNDKISEGKPYLTNHPDIQGWCPMGCGRTLFVGQGGYITCSYIHCPRPDAISDLLDDNEIEHIVEFGETGFTIRHPLRERLDDALMACKLHEYIANLPGPPVKPGRYRAEDRQAFWAWETLTATAPAGSADTAAGGPTP